MLRLERRKEPSRLMRWAAPLLALTLTILGSLLLFWLIGRDPWRAVYLIYVSPLTSMAGITEVLVKATPLVLIATGLAFGFRAGVWNIGAEGQFVMGAIAGGAVALAFYDTPGLWLLPLMCVTAMAAGAAWAAIPALLRVRYGASEILVSLMLVYVATLFLEILMHGPLRDPEGLNFPESRLFHSSAKLPIIIPESRAHAGVLVALFVAAAAAWLFARHVAGFAVRLQGSAPDAARFAGFRESRTIWMTLTASGALAGMAGLFEAAGPVGQLVPALPQGYGFTAIIVAFLGQLTPSGIVVAGLVLAVTYIGTEAAQVAMSVPSAVTGVFLGLLLFILLALDVFVRYRLVWRPRRRPMARSIANEVG